MNNEKDKIMYDILWTIANKDILPKNESFFMNSVDGLDILKEYIKKYYDSNVLILTNHHSEKKYKNDNYLTIFLVKNKENLINEITETVSSLLNGKIKFKIEEFVFPTTIIFYDKQFSYHLINYDKGTIIV